MTYQEAKQKAQQGADSLGMDHGVEQVHGGYTWFILPRRENRQGSRELRCEVVHPTLLDSCQPGHGPV